MTHGAHLLLLLLTSSLLTWTPAGASVSCPWTTVLPSGQVLHTFLRSAASSPPPPPPALRLYHIVWSAGERALLGCVWSEDPAVIRDHLNLCRDEHEPGVLDELNPGDVAEMEERCVNLTASFSSSGVASGEARAGQRQVRSLARGSQQRSEVRRHQRVKRGFIVPGTLWCGSGNKAPSYSDLGVFEETDSCCREHDQCKNTILSFHSQFGVFNSNIFTMSHCDCDNKFHSCLMEASDSISDVVGYTFFNLLKMHCFTFSHRLQCTQRNWFGMCKETKMALYAEVHGPTVYDTEVGMNSSITNITNSSITGAAASTIPATSASVLVTKVTASNKSEGAAASTPEIRDDLGNASSSRSRDQPEQEEEITEKQLSCAVYKDLDECRDKIFPQQKKYGLHNPEARMLYHCNCTTRLFQTLAKQRQVTKVQSLLLGHVSPSCFMTPNCTSSKICSAVLVKAGLPQPEQSSSAAVEEQRHLQAVTLKVRRPNMRRSKRKDRGVRLHKLCLKMVKRRTGD